MSYKATVRHTTITRVLILSCLLVLCAGPAAQADAPRFCTDAYRIEPGETVRATGSEAGAPDCFRLETSGSGLLMLDAAVPGPATAPRLSLLDADCERKAKGLVTQARSASHLMVEVTSPQSLVVCAGAQDPLRRLDDFTLRTVFVPVEAFGLAAHKDEQVELEPDGKDEQVELEPDGKDEQVELEPDGLTSGTRAVLCGSAAADDHADVAPCATRLVPGRPVAGEIGNAWGDDLDVFTFELRVPRTVRLETTGADTVGQLYDRHGQRLAEAEGFRLVRTLAPGVYFVRVEGPAWTAGGYGLQLDFVVRSW